MASNNPSCLQWLGSGEVCTRTRSDPEGKFCPGCGVKFSDKRAIGESRCPSLNKEGVRCGSILTRDDYTDGNCCGECGEEIPLEVWQQVPDWSIPVDPAKHPRSHICHQILADGTMCRTQSNPEKSPKYCKNGNCKIPFAVRVEVPEIKCSFGQEGAVCGRTLQKPADNRPFFCASCGSFIPTEIWNQVDRKADHTSHLNDAIEPKQISSAGGIYSGSHIQEHQHTTFRNNNLTGSNFNQDQRMTQIAIGEEKRQPKSCEQSFKQVLAASGLTDYFPSKLGIQEVMQICDMSTCESVSDKVLFFYQRLITLDSLARDKFESDSEKSASENVQTFPSSAMDLLSRFNTGGAQKSPLKDNGIQIHPLDFFLLAYLCGDQSLRDTFIKKTFLCRLALPLFYPTFKNGEFEMLLGPLRSIILEWKAKAENKVRKTGSTLETKTNYETDAVSAPCHFVLFSRVSRSERYRKSKIMNDILCKTIHPTFCHWDCPNGTRERLLTDGLVEGSWYIPSGKDSDLFSSLIMFMNLRGDLLEHLENFEMICNVASVVVQLVSICDLTKNAVLTEISTILNQEIPVVLLIHDDKSQSTDAFNQYLQKALIQLQSGCANNSISFLTILPTTENGQLKNADKIKLDLRQVISRFTQTLPEKSFEFLIDKVKNNDESTPINKKGKELSTNALMPIKRDKGSRFVKIEHMKGQLPLQGDLWKQWSMTQKKKNRPFTSTGQSSVDAINDLEREMNEIRQKQFALCLNPSPLMSAFIEGLSFEEPNCGTTMNFLRWMRYFLDDNSRKTLPNFHDKYNKLWLKLRSYKGKQDEENSKKVEDLQLKVKKAEEEFANASFGLEHLMREIGQMYEAVTEGADQYLTSSQYVEKVKRLPRRIAELIYSGQPIELMDGDATNIPLSWIKAVFKELHVLLGAKSVFVISVLGIQSSGKSTLLNTMFGLQFAVSAGRCTKGVYMQLVRVNKQSNLPFDYVCVVDTEGLRAAELGMTNFDRDNELATFVIGLGDLTIINIKGESYSEMKDVLQIVVHAFLRIKLVIEQNHQCIFIHQNVGAANAQEKMQFGCQKLQENLDEMTVEAAEQENRKGVRTFNDVIEFDCLKDVYFFPDLWHGDPPMAHANPGYHEQIAAIKQKIFLSKNKNKSDEPSFWSFEKISSRISDLWTAILADDFVFAFRNSLEVKAYNTLEQKHRSLIFQAEAEFLDWKQKTADKYIKNCDDERQINSCQQQLDEMILNIAGKIKNTLEEDFVKYIKNDSHSDLMIKWQDDKVLSLKHEVDSKVTYYKNSISEALDNQRVRLLRNMNNSPFIKELTAEACKLAEKLRSGSKEIHSKDLELEFTKLWNGRTANLSSRIPRRITDDSIEQQISHQLYNYFRSQNAMNVAEALKVNPIAKPFGSEGNPMIPAVTTKDFTVSTVEDASVASSISNKFKRLVRYNGTKAIQVAETSMEDGLKTAYDNLHSLGESVQFTTKIITDLLEHAFKTSWEQKSVPFEKTTVITFTASYVPYIAVHICRYAFPLFCRKHAKYESTEGYVSQLNKYKETLWNLFQNKYNKVNDELICADIVKDNLTERIRSITQDLIPEKIKFEVSQMYETKQCFVREILIDLAKRNHSGKSKVEQKRLMFEEIFRYIRYPRIYAGQWFSRVAEHFITTKDSSGQTKLGNIGAAYIPIMCEEINERLDHMTADEGDQVPLKTWIDNFCKFKTDSLHVLETDFSIDDSQNGELVTVLEFNKYIKKKVAHIKLSLKQEYLEASPEELGCESSLYENVVDSIWGCKENCPLCGEPCFDSSVGHEKTYPHRCMQHKPSGLKGVYSEGSNLLSLSNCNYDVASEDTYYFEGDQKPFDEYKNYKKYHPKWDIDPNTSNTTSVPFWCWVYATFNEEFAKKYGRVKPEIPSEWKKITKDKAIESLQVAYANK